MIIEWLKVKVPAALRAQYIQKDAEIWTGLLSNYSGFLGKEVWINPKDDTEIIIVIRWHDRTSWHSIPRAALQATDRRFTQALGQAFPFTETGEYQVFS
jgi:uncharacterized protein (TIGR03792 family)